jgi:hypothetical protein
MKSIHSSNPAIHINSCDISAINNNSIFKRIIKSSLILYPKDAHQYILNYLISSGLNEKSIIIFQQVWSKTLIGLQSFGKLNNNNNNNNNVDPELFSSEFIHELSLSDQKILELLNTSITCFKLDQYRRRNSTAVVDMATSSSLSLSSESAGYDVINPLDDIRALEAMSRLGQELATALTDVYDDVLLKELDRHHRRSGRYKMNNGHNDGDTADDSIHDDDDDDDDDDDAVYHSSSTEEMFESISLFRRSLRGTRIIWQHNVMINESNASYSPLDRLIHGYPGMIRGILG